MIPYQTIIVQTAEKTAETAPKSTDQKESCGQGVRPSLFDPWIWGLYGFLVGWLGRALLPL